MMIVACKCMWLGHTQPEENHIWISRILILIIVINNGFCFLVFIIVYVCCLQMYVMWKPGNPEENHIENENERQRTWLWYSTTSSPKKYTRWCQDLLPADRNHLAIKPRSKKAANSQFRAFLSDTALAQKSVAKEQLNPSPFPKIQSNFHFQKAPACCFAASSPDVFPACGQKDVWKILLTKVWWSFQQARGSFLQ